MKCTIRWSSLQNKPLQRDIKLCKYAWHYIISLCVCNHQYDTEAFEELYPQQNWPFIQTFWSTCFYKEIDHRKRGIMWLILNPPQLDASEKKFSMFMPTESKSYADGHLSVGHTHRNVSNVMPVETGSSLGQLEVAGGFEATRRSPD